MPDRTYEWTQEDRTDFLNGLGLLVSIFWGPDLEWCQDCLAVSPKEALERFGALLDESGRQAALIIGAWINKYDQALEMYDDLEVDYVRLFVNAPGGVKAPIYHSYYVTEEKRLMGPPALDMQRRLSAAGLDLRSLAGHPPDHLAVEIEYCLLLLETAWTQNSEGLLAEASAFASEDMLPWVLEFESRLADEEAEGFFPAAARLLVSALRRTEELKKAGL